METASLSNEQRQARSGAAISALLEIARDLTSSLAARDRYDRLLAAVRRVLPYDAACLLRLEGDELVPIAGHGLVHEALVTNAVKTGLAKLSLEPAGTSPAEFARLIQSETQRWAEVVKISGFQPLD